MERRAEILRLASAITDLVVQHPLNDVFIALENVLVFCMAMSCPDCRKEIAETLRDHLPAMLAAAGFATEISLLTIRNSTICTESVARFHSEVSCNAKPTTWLSPISRKRSRAMSRMTLHAPAVQLDFRASGGGDSALGARRKIAQLAVDQLGDEYADRGQHE